MESSSEEPAWVLYVREYVIPATVFAAMAYYLIWHVLLPMREVGFPTRHPVAHEPKTNDDHAEATPEDATQ